MKKQLILSALIFSLSFACVTFALNPKKISDQQNLQDDLFKMAKKNNIRAVIDNENQLKAKELTVIDNENQLKAKELKCKTGYMIDKVLIGAATSALATTTYFFLTKQFNTLSEKKAFTVITTGLSVLSYDLFGANRKIQSEEYKKYEQEKDSILKTALPYLKTELKNQINNHIESKILNKKLPTNELLETLSEELKNITLTEDNESEEELLKTIEKVKKIEKSLLNESNNKSKEELLSTIKKAKEIKEDLLSENNNELIPSEIKEAVEGLKKITEYSKCKQVNKHYKGTIIAGLFGLTNVSIWAPEICSNFAKMTNFAVPYFNNIKIPNFTKKFPFTKS